VKIYYERTNARKEDEGQLSALEKFFERTGSRVVGEKGGRVKRERKETNLPSSIELIVSNKVGVISSDSVQDESLISFF